MFSPASIAPAPNPAGIDQTHNAKILLESEKPKSERAIIAEESKVTVLVPNLFISLALKKLDSAVPIEIIIVTKLA